MAAIQTVKKKDLILITGAAGFIGSALIWHLNKEGLENIIAVDRFRSAQKWLNLRGLLFEDFVHPEKILDYLKERDLKSRIKTIVHLGACSKTTETDMDYLFENNVNFSKAMFHLAKDCDARFIYASSGATYGSLERFDDNVSPENLRPLNQYGYSKNLFDQWICRQLETDKEVSAIGLKFFNVFGPNEYHKGAMASVLFHAYFQYKESSEVRLFKSGRKDYLDGGQRRDFIYVKDVVRLIKKFMDAQTVKSALYNIGTGESNTFYDFVSPLFEVLSEKVKIAYIDMPSRLEGRYQYFTEAKMQKTFSELGMMGLNQSFFTPLNAAVKDYVKNYLMKDRRLDILEGEQ